MKLIKVSNTIKRSSWHSVGQQHFVVGFRSLLPIAQLVDLCHLEIAEEFEGEIVKLVESDLLIEILKNLTKLETFKLCDKGESIEWSIKSVDLARLISHHLPHLWLFHAPCHDQCN